MKRYQIKSWLDGRIAWEGDAGSWKHAIEQAIQSNADLTRADLTDADLTDAVLTDAVLTRADLTGADLTRADLTRAVLTDADLTRADLTDAVLTDADLTRADLTPVRDDIWAILSAMPKEVQGLRDALAAGRVDGSCYSGECSCLVGTLARCAGKGVGDLANLSPNSDRPAEKFFMGIKPGDTPEKSPISKMALMWVDEWLSNMKAAFAAA